MSGVLGGSWGGGACSYGRGTPVKLPISSQLGTNQPGKAKFCLWLESSQVRKSLNPSRLFPAHTAATLIRASVYDKYSGSMKVTTRLTHTHHYQPAYDTTWSNRWTYRVFIINTRRDQIWAWRVQEAREHLSLSLSLSLSLLPSLSPSLSLPLSLPLSLSLSLSLLKVRELKPQAELRYLAFYFTVDLGGRGGTARGLALPRPV